MSSLDRRASGAIQHRPHSTKRRKSLFEGAALEALEQRCFLSGAITVSQVVSHGTAATVQAAATSTTTTYPAPVADGQGSATSPGPVLDPTTPTFQWQPITGVTGMTGYQINLYDQTLSKFYSYQVGTSVTSYSAPSSVLVASDKFVWNVRIIVGTTTGTESNYLYFQAPPAAALPAPVATGPGSTTSPGTVLTTSTPTFQWDAVTGVSGLTGYQINLYDSTLAKSYSYQVGATATSYTLPAGVLTAGDSFVWNVRILVGTQSGPPSAYFYFQAPPATVALPAPVVTEPGSTSSPGPVLTTSTPTLRWNAVTGVTGLTGYQINLYDSTLAKSYSYQVGATVTSYTLPAGVLTGGDSFVWNVRVLVGTQSGPPSTYFYFQAPAAVVALPAPVATGPGSTTSPGTVLTTSTPTFEWNAVTGVTGLTGYQINLYDSTLGKSYSYQAGATATSYTLPAGVLTAGDSFVWNVRILVGTQSGPPSTYFYFQAPPAAVVLPAPTATGQGSTSKPGDVLTTSTPTLSWNAVTGVTGLTGYQIYLTDLTASKTFSYQVGASVTSYTVPASTLTAGDDFVWNVRVLVGTQSGPPSNYLYFQAPAAVAIPLPAPVANGPGGTTKPGTVLTTSTPTLSWNAVTGVTGLTGYQIYLTDLTASKTFSYQVGASVTSYTVAAGALAAGDSFVWNVRVLVGTQSGPPSTYLYFQTPAATVTLPAPVATEPGTTSSPGPVLTTSVPTFRWNAVTGVTGLTGYQINLYDSTLGKSYSYQVGATATSYTLPSGVLTAGDSFVWNVRVLAGNQSGPPSSYFYFQAPAAAVVLPTPVSTAPGGTTKPGTTLTTSTPTLSWKAVTSAIGLTGYQIYLTDLTLGKTYSYQVGAAVTSYDVTVGTLTAGDDFVWNVRVLAGTQSGPPSTYLYFLTPAGATAPSSPQSPAATVIAADSAKLVRLEAEQHETTHSLKAATSGTTTYKTLLQEYDALEKRIKSLKSARAALESEV